MSQMLTFLRRYPHSASLVAAGALMAGIHWALPLATVIEPPWTLLSVVPLAIGAFLALAVNRELARAGTTINPDGETSALVTGGVFRLSRHPMYLAMVIGLSGFFIGLGTLGPALVIPAFIWFVDRNFAASEDRLLERRFGGDYRRYAQTVRRWI
jgi:protein-S-isoprenylcysteine O-methyltransferase Ste14